VAEYQNCAVLPDREAAQNPDEILYGRSVVFITAENIGEVVKDEQNRPDLGKLGLQLP